MPKSLVSDSGDGAAEMNMLDDSRTSCILDISAWGVSRTDIRARSRQARNI